MTHELGIFPMEMKVGEAEAAFEFTGDDLFVLLDGRRIARRGQPGTAQAKTWVPMVPGYEVVDGKKLNSIVVTFRDPRFANIAFGKIRNAPKNARWVWACQCSKCEQIDPIKRAHDPFRTRRDAERDAEATVLLLASEPETGRLLS